MARISKSILCLIAASILLFMTTSFLFSPPSPDFEKERILFNEHISLSDITRDRSEDGRFRSALKFNRKNENKTGKEFYGQEILIADNPNMDKIMLGVTNNLISRIEIWNHNQLVETKELGFMNKMTWGSTQNMTIDFYDHTCEKYQGKSGIRMRFYNGTGFFGDIGTIAIDLTRYGDLSSRKSIGVFAKSLDSKEVTKPCFSNLQIWKNYNIWD